MFVQFLLLAVNLVLETPLVHIPGCRQWLWQRVGCLQPNGGRTTQALYTSASVAERQRAALAAAHDAQVRAASVRTDLALELPPTVALPEEHPLTMSVHLRDADQEQELYGACVRAPPNRTVTDSCPPCRSGSLSLVQRNCATPLVMRSHSVSVAQCRRTAPWPSSAGSTDCGRPGGV